MPHKNLNRVIPEQHLLINSTARNRNFAKDAMGTLPKTMPLLVFIGIFGLSAPVAANFDCEIQAQAYAENNVATAPGGFYYAEGLCLLQDGDADGGQWSWVKWLYLEPDAPLPSQAKQWVSTYQAAHAERAQLGATEIKVIKKQRFGSAKTLFLLEMTDPLELLYVLHIVGPEGDLLLRAAPKMEVALPGLEKSTVYALDRQGQQIRQIELAPLLPKSRTQPDLAKKSKSFLPWWGWAAIGGASTVAAGTGLWLWWDSRDDIYLRGRATVGDAS